MGILYIELFFDRTRLPIRSADSANSLFGRHKRYLRSIFGAAPAAAPCDMPHFAAARRKTLAPQATFFRDSRYICGFSLVFEPRIMHAAFGRRSKIEKSPHAVSTRADPPPPSATLHRAASLEKMSAEAAAARIERSHAPATRGVPAVSVEESPRRCVSAVKHRRRRFRKKWAG